MRVSIVTCSNKLKLTKSVRSHWACLAGLLLPLTSHPSPLLLFLLQLAATCGVQLVASALSTSRACLSTRLDNKCQHFAAANLFARLMRAPIAGGLCFYVSTSPSSSLPLLLLATRGMQMWEHARVVVQVQLKRNF